jgi:hypothetical protein
MLENFAAEYFFRRCSFFYLRTNTTGELIQEAASPLALQRFRLMQDIRGRELCCLICYPSLKGQLVKKQDSSSSITSAKDKS